MPVAAAACVGLGACVKIREKGGLIDQGLGCLMPKLLARHTTQCIEWGPCLLLSNKPFVWVRFTAVDPSLMFLIAVSAVD